MRIGAEFAGGTLAVIAQLADGTLAYFGKRITASAVLDRSGKMLRLVHREQAFDTLDAPSRRSAAGSIG